MMTFMTLMICLRATHQQPNITKKRVVTGNHVQRQAEVGIPNLGVQIKYSRLNSFNLMTVAHNSVTTACVLLLSVGVLSFFTPLFKSL